MMATQLGLDFLQVLLPDEARISLAAEPLTTADEVVARIGPQRSAPHGWTTVSQHLLLPRATAPRLVLPAAPARLLFRALDSYRPTRPAARAALLGLRALALVGVGGQLPWRRVTVWRRDGCPPKHGALWTDLQQKVPRAAAWAASTGTPGPFRKASLRIMDDSGAALAQVKVGRDGPAAQRITAESEALIMLATLPLRRARLPRLLSDGAQRDHRWLVQQHLGDGTAARPSLGQIGDFHVELQGMTGRQAPLRTGAYWARLSSRMASLSKSVAAEAWRYGCRPLAERSVRLGVMHGDLAPWNVMCCTDGQLAIFDWETCCEGAPPLLDLLHWLLYPPLLAGRRDAEELLVGLMRGVDGKHLRSMASRLRCELPWSALLLLYLVDWISRLEVEQQGLREASRARQIARLERLLRATMVLRQGEC